MNIRRSVYQSFIFFRFFSFFCFCFFRWLRLFIFVSTLFRPNDQFSHCGTPYAKNYTKYTNDELRLKFRMAISKGNVKLIIFILSSFLFFFSMCEKEFDWLSNLYLPDQISFDEIVSVQIFLVIFSFLFLNIGRI